jgi:hypothetical protein
LKSIPLVILLSVFLGARAFKAHSAEPPVARLFAAPVTDHSEKGKFAGDVADRFIDAMRKRNYSFLTEAKFRALRREIHDFTARYDLVQISSSDQEMLLTAVERYVPEHFSNRGLDFPEYFSDGYDVEEAYLKFRDQVNTFKWKLWLALTRSPATSEQLKRREAQHNWLRESIADAPIRPGDGRPLGVAPDGVRAWASAYLERKFADPLSLLHDPMTDRQFEVFKKLMVRSAANGLYNMVTDTSVRALGARAHDYVDVERAYAYPFDIELPFEDEVRSIWGGARPHLAFASNAQFRGQDVYLDARSRPIFDIVSGLCLIEPHEQAGDPDASIARWTQRHNSGDIAYRDATASIAALRGAKIAELRVANWFDADRVSNAELRKLIAENGVTSVSVKSLPPMNGGRRVGVNEPRFFIVVQEDEGCLAVMDLRSREFGLYLVSRLRPADSPDR